jgi:hypothetical protein
MEQAVGISQDGLSSSVRVYCPDMLSMDSIMMMVELASRFERVMAVTAAKRVRITSSMKRRLRRQ